MPPPPPPPVAYTRKRSQLSPKKTQIPDDDEENVTKCRCGKALTRERPYCTTCKSMMRGTKENKAVKKQQEDLKKKMRAASSRPLPEIEDRIVVTMTDNSSTRLVGTVRYVGKTVFAAGDWIGVELDQPRGKNSGKVFGAAYFECQPYHGLFVQPVSVIAQGDEVERWLEENAVEEELEEEVPGLMEVEQDLANFRRASARNLGAEQPDVQFSQDTITAIKAALKDQGVDGVGLGVLRKELMGAREAIRHLMLINRELVAVNDRLESGEDIEELQGAVRRPSVLQRRIERKEAAVQIQRRYRGKLQQREYQKTQEQRQKAAMRIQARQRGKQGREVVREKQKFKDTQKAEKRKQRINMIFEAYATEGEYVKARDMFHYAKKIGYPSTQLEFEAEEYEHLCMDYRVVSKTGFSLGKFLDLTDAAESDYYCNDDLLKGLLVEIFGGDTDEDVIVENRFRFDAVRAIFMAFDLSGDGTLNLMEAYTFAKSMGIASSLSAYQEDFKALCQEAQCDPEKGFGMSFFRQMLDDEKNAHYCNDTRLEKFLKEKMSTFGIVKQANEDEDWIFFQKKTEDARAGLSEKLFAALDVKQKKRLKANEMLQFAKILGFPTGRPSKEGEFSVQYTQICGNLDVSEKEGLALESFRELVGNPLGHLPAFYLTNGKMFSMSTQIQLQREENREDIKRQDAAKKREEKVVTLFKTLDTDYNEKLTGNELFAFAVCVGFPGSFKEFDSEYKDLCTDYKCEVNTGLNLKCFREVVNDRSSDYFCDDQMLDEFLAKLPPPPSRAERIQNLFKLLDVKKNARLNQAELFPFAQEVGFPGSSDEFKDEYETLCQETDTKPATGLDEATFSKVVSDKSSDFFCDDKMLSDFLRALAGKISAPSAPAEEKTEVTRELPKAPQTRADRIGELFKTVDKNKNGRLSCVEVFRFAQELGFPGTVEEFKPDFDDLCKEAGAENGITAAEFTKMVDNPEHDCYCDEETLSEVLGKLGPADAEAAAPANSAAAEAPTSDNAVANNAVPSDPPGGVSASGASATPKPATREDYIKALFNALDVNKTGRLTCPEMYKFAGFVGYEDPEEEFNSSEYADLCKDKNIDVKTGIDLDYFTELVNDDEGAYGTEDESLLDYLKQLGVDPSAAATQPKSADAAPDSAADAAAAEATEEEGPLRKSLITQFFGLLDKDKDRRLDRSELYVYAQLVGYPASEEDFQEEYEGACGSQNCTTESGIDAEAFSRMVTDPEGDYALEDGDQLQDFISQLGGKPLPPSGKPRSGEPASGEAAFGQVASGAAGQATSGPAAEAAPEQPQSRDDLLMAVFKALDKDQDQRLTQSEMFVAATQVGFPEDEDFGEEYEGLCTECSCDPSVGLDFAAFKTQVSDSEKDYYMDDNALRSFLSELQPGSAAGNAGGDDAVPEADADEEEEEGDDAGDNADGDEGGGESEASRDSKVKALFEMLDRKKQGWVEKASMFEFAQFIEYPGSREEFYSEEWIGMCNNKGINPEEGLNLDVFASLVNDQEGDWGLPDESIDEFLEALSKSASGTPSSPYKTLFDACDQNKDGNLNLEEMFKFAQVLGYPDELEDFKASTWQELSEQYKIDPASGLDFEIFTKMTADEESEFGIAEEDIQGYLDELKT